MGMTSETLRLLITGDADGAVQAFRKAGAAADKDLGKAEDKAAKTSAQLTKMGAASLAAGGVMVAALASTIGPASDLNEAINVTGLVFKDSAGEIESWADSAATSMGQSKRAALEGAAAIGGLLNNVGFLEDESAQLSTQLVELASDMGSAFNMEPAEALAALRSGLAGESEPLKRFNVFLSETAVKAKAMELGISDGTGALSEHEKAQARLAIIMEQTSDIQGDFAATADGAANSQRILAAQFEDMKAEIGQAVLPIFQELVGALSGLASAFNDLPAPIKGLVGQVAVFTTGLLLFGGAAMTAAGRVKNLGVALKTVSGSWKGAALAGGAMTAIVIAANKAWDDHNARVANAADRIDRMKDAIEGANGPVSAATQFLRDYAQEHSEFAEVLAGLTNDELDELASAISGQGELTDETRDKLNDLMGGFATTGAVLNELTGEFETATEELDNLASGANVADSTTAALAGSVDSLYRNAGNAAASAEELSGSLGRTWTPAKELRDVMDEVNEELDEFFGSIGSNQELAADFQKALDDAADSIETNGKAIGVHTDEERANLAARQAVIDEIERKVDQMVEEGATTDEIVRKSRNMIKAYEDTLVAAGLTREEAEAYTRALGDIPEEVETRLIQSGYDEVAANAAYLKSLFDSMDGRTVTTYFVSVQGSGGTVQTQSGATSAEMDGDPSTTAEDPDGDGVAGLSLSGGKKQKRSGSGGVTHTTIVELDGREIARSVERVSERDGGLRIKTRAGG